MAVITKGTRSYRKIAVEQETNLIGYKKTVFAHKAAGGETGITISSLTLPTEMTGFTNPSFNEIESANMKLFRNNVRITSSLRGTLIDYLSYNIPIKERIDWVGFTAEAGEIFVVEIDPNNRTGPQVVDAAPLVATGTLAGGVTDFSVGASFEVNKYPAAQIGAVLVFLDGQLQFRNTSNATAAPSADGNYQEVDSGVGFGTIIRFNSSDVSARSVVVVSNGLLVEKPNESQMSEIEKVQGQVDKLIQTTAALAGVPTTDFQAAPSQVQLQQFGDRVIALEQEVYTLDHPNVRGSEGAGTTALTSTDNMWQIFALSASRNVNLPTTGIFKGQLVRLENTTNFDLIVQSSAGTALTMPNGSNYEASIQKGFVQLIALQDAPTTPAHWRVLEVFEETSDYALAATSAVTTTHQCAVTRSNNIVTYGIAANSLAASAASDTISLNTTPIPARLKVTDQRHSPAAAYSGSTQIIGHAFADPAPNAGGGSINFKRYDNGNWTNNAGIGNGNVRSTVTFRR